MHGFNTITDLKSTAQAKNNIDKNVKKIGQVLTSEYFSIYFTSGHTLIKRLKKCIKL